MTLHMKDSRDKNTKWHEENVPVKIWTIGQDEHGDSEEYYETIFS